METNGVTRCLISALHSRSSVSDGGRNHARAHVLIAAEPGDEAGIRGSGLLRAGLQLVGATPVVCLPVFPIPDDGRFRRNRESGYCEK